MEMNEIFNAARFGQELKKYVRDNRGSIIYGGAFVTAVMVLIGVINAIAYRYDKEPSRGFDEEMGFMCIAFFIGGCMVASKAFKSMGDARSALSTLMVPASQFEKFLARWIVVVPCFMVWTLVSAVVADVIKVIMAGVIGDAVYMLPWGELISGTGGYGCIFYFVVLMFLAIQSFFLLGAIVWRKQNYVKTFFVIGVIFLIYVITAGIVGDMCRLPRTYIDGYDMFRFVPLNIFTGLMVVVNYALTYMRFRESEIIQRW